jgi:hypothetical protein
MPRGGRRTEAEVSANANKCANREDAVTGDLITQENAIRLLENGHYFCYDINTLFQWFNTGKRTNPETNLRFSDANITKIEKKFRKVGLVVVPPFQLRPADRNFVNFFANNLQVVRSLVVVRPEETYYIGTRTFFCIQWGTYPNGEEILYSMIFVPDEATVIFFTRRTESFRLVVEAVRGNGRAPEEHPTYVIWQN